MYPTEHENDPFFMSKQHFFFLEATEFIKIIEIYESFDLGCEEMEHFTISKISEWLGWLVGWLGILCTHLSTATHRNL